MSRTEVAWYGRMAVWIGCGLLFLMAFGGIQSGIVTVVAVTAVTSGVVLLMYSIPWRVTRRTLPNGRRTDA